MKQIKRSEVAREIAELEAQLERKDKVVQVLARVFQSGSSCENCPLGDGNGVDYCVDYSGCDDNVIKWAEQEVDNAVT